LNVEEHEQEDIKIKIKIWSAVSYFSVYMCKMFLVFVLQF